MIKINFKLYILFILVVIFFIFLSCSKNYKKRVINSKNQYNGITYEKNYFEHDFLDKEILYYNDKSKLVEAIYNYNKKTVLDNKIEEKKVQFDDKLNIIFEEKNYTQEFIKNNGVSKIKEYYSEEKLDKREIFYVKQYKKYSDIYKTVDFFKDDQKVESEYYFRELKVEDNTKYNYIVIYYNNEKKVKTERKIIEINFNE